MPILSWRRRFNKARISPRTAWIGGNSSESSVTRSNTLSARRRHWFVHTSAGIE